MTNIIKQLNVEAWTLETVIEWLKGVSSYSINYTKSFEAQNLNGKKLAILELSDLSDILKDHENAVLNHQLTIFKSVQNLLQMKHDLNKETLHSLIFNTQNRIVAILNYLSRLASCSCIINDCERCVKYKRNEIISASTSLALAYRRLISWLVRIPFTRLKPFENFREEINNEMKNFLRLFRKRIFSDNFYKEMKIKLKSMLECCKKMLIYCDKNCEKENGKIAVAYSCCYLEKVFIRRKDPEQVLGLKLTTLSDGIFTIAEIVRESAADESPHLNVEDDIIAVNNQIVVGWNSENIIKLLENAFNSNTVLHLILRKMPKDHLTSIKQQKKLVFIYKNQNVIKSTNENNSNTNKNEILKFDKQQSETGNKTCQRKHSLADIFDLSEEFTMEDSSDEDEEDYEDFNRNNKNNNSNINDFSIGATDFYNENNGSRLVNTTNMNITNENKLLNKEGKLVKKSNANRLIRSMQNLLSFDRSRSNSVEKTGFNNEEANSNKNQRKKSIENSSDLFKSLFTNKRWDFAPSSNSNKNSFESLDSPSTPNLIGVRKIDSIKRANSKTSNNSNSSINECGVSRKSDADYTGNQLIQSPSTVKMVSRKPPIDKNKETYKMKTQKPTVQGWLYKKLPPTTSNSQSKNSNNINSDTNIDKKNLITHTGKWKKYWCVLTKDYITFYKNPDEKIPKDFLLLKDFEITKEEVSSRKFGFMIFDKSKQFTHEFHTDQNEDFYEWFQVLSELRLKLMGGESLTSTSTNSLSSSGYDTNNNNNKDNDNGSVYSSSQSLPASSTSTLSRTNNLQLQLSTIVDHNDDSFNNSIHKNEISQQYNSSSRESSPEYNSKVASRDSSPGLSYPYLQELETSESDAEFYARPDNKDAIQAKNGKTQLKKKNLSSSSLTSAILADSSTMSSSETTNNFIKQKSCSPSDHQNFIYNYHDTENNTNQIQHQRCNSLPGSLQACVGSFLNEKNSLNKIMPENQNACVNNVQTTNCEGNEENLTNIPVQLEYDNTTNDNNPKNNKNQGLQNLLLQFQKRELMPKLIKRKKSSVESSVLTTDNQSPDNSDSPSSSPNVSLYVSQLNNRQQNQQPTKFNYYYQQQSSSPKTPPINNIGKTTKISVQLGRSGIPKINAFNFLTTADQSPNFGSNLRNQIQRTDYCNPLPTADQMPSSVQSPTSPLVYRTELTIMPSSSKKTALNTNIFNNSNTNFNNYVNSQSPQQSSWLTKQFNFDIENKRYQS